MDFKPEKMHVNPFKMISACIR